MISIPLSLIFACQTTTTPVSDKVFTTEEVLAQDYDLDGDGYLASEECDDGDGLINPGMTEICDGIDNNCNGEIDENVTTIYYADMDRDRFGDNNNFVDACEMPDGYVMVGNDCDDNQVSVFPGASEVCNAIDDDCDGEIDEDLLLGLFFDADGDGHGDPNIPSSNCTDREGYVYYNDDCDDTDASIHPYQVELCDDIDNNCNGIVDELVNQYYYYDGDGDGYGDYATFIQACEPIANFVDNDDDCDDIDSAMHPNATEYCNQRDDDCDGVIDEDSVDAPLWYYDVDGDGYGSGFITMYDCQQPTHYVDNNADCDDTRPTVFPGGVEYCNSLDNDCNGLIDDNPVNGVYWYADYDNDDYGDPVQSIYQCTQPFDHILNNTDCDDGLDDVHPNADEYCNGEDDDCDGVVDNDAVDATVYYLDSDGDGFGDATQILLACEEPEGYVLDNTDCDDGNNTIYPGAHELCDGIDQNCNGTNFYELDLDGNGLLACQESIWIRNSASNSTSPYGSCSQAASYLLNAGVTVHDMYHGNTVVTSALLENYGLYVHHGNNMNGALGAYTNSEATALEDWVYNGGRLLFIGFHSTQEACEASNSIPYQFGVSCDNVYYSWNGTTSTFVNHPITANLGTVGGLGGENWVVTPPAQILAYVGQYEFLVVVEHGAGKVVLIADEWPFYNNMGWGYDITFASNRQMVRNIWNWLLE